MKHAKKNWIALPGNKTAINVVLKVILDKYAGRIHNINNVLKMYKRFKPMVLIRILVKFKMMLTLSI